MKKIFLFVISSALLVSCSKDKFKTEPQVEITSFGPSEVINKGTFALNAMIRDKEGDLQDSLIFYRKFYNGNTLFRQDSSLRYSLKDFGVPVKDEIEIQLSFSYGEDRSLDNYIFQSLEQADRGLVIGVVVRDNAGHRSEYVESNKILLRKYP